MILSEFETYKFDLNQLKKYEEFLIECSKKEYLNLNTHIHHILPKFMKGSNKKDNLMRLSIEDHFSAHVILAECFDISSFYYKGNMYSANRLRINIDVPDNFNVILPDNFNFRGCKHSDESKKLISESKKGKSPERWIIEAANASRRGVPLTQEHKIKNSESMKLQYKTGVRKVNLGNMDSPKRIIYRNKLSERGKNKQNGKDNPFAKKIEHVESGEIFNCLKDAMDKFGFTNYNILKRRIDKGVFRYLENYKPNIKFNSHKSKPIKHIESGKVFESMTATIKYFNMPNHGYLKRRIDRGIFSYIEDIS